MALIMTIVGPAWVEWADVHSYADQRSILGIPNTLDVVTNLPFIILGLAGLYLILRGRIVFMDPTEKWPYLFAFSGFIAAGLCSSYYHWDPSHERLIWDRLPQALILASLAAAVFAERAGPRIGITILIPLTVYALGSALYWGQTHDLRYYTLLNFLVLVIWVPFLIMWFEPRYSGVHWWGWMYLSLFLSRILEGRDQDFFEAFGISGHSLKHLFASAVALLLIAMLLTRRVHSNTGPSEE